MNNWEYICITYDYIYAFFNDNEKFLRKIVQVHYIFTKYIFLQVLYIFIWIIGNIYVSYMTTYMAAFIDFLIKNEKFYEKLHYKIIFYH